MTIDELKAHARSMGGDLDVSLLPEVVTVEFDNGIVSKRMQEILDNNGIFFGISNHPTHKHDLIINVPANSDVIQIDVNKDHDDFPGFYAADDIMEGIIDDMMIHGQGINGVRIPWMKQLLDKRLEENDANEEASSHDRMKCYHVIERMILTLARTSFTDKKDDFHVLNHNPHIGISGSFVQLVRKFDVDEQHRSLAIELEDAKLQAMYLEQSMPPLEGLIHVIQDSTRSFVGITVQIDDMEIYRQVMHTLNDYEQGL